MQYKLATLPKLKTNKQSLNNLVKDTQNLVNNAEPKGEKKVQKKVRIKNKLAKKAREKVEKIDKLQDKS